MKIKTTSALAPLVTGIEAGVKVVHYSPKHTASISARREGAIAVIGSTTQPSQTISEGFWSSWRKRVVAMNHHQVSPITKTHSVVKVTEEPRQVETQTRTVKPGYFGPRDPCPDGETPPCTLAATTATLSHRHACPLDDTSCLPLPDMTTLATSIAQRDGDFACPLGVTSCGPPPKASLWPSGIHIDQATAGQDADNDQSTAFTTAVLTQVSDGSVYNPIELSDTSFAVIDAADPVPRETTRNCTRWLPPACLPQ